MAEALKISKDAPKDQIYEEIIPQIKALIEGEDNLIANLSNIAAVLDTAFGHLWTGFYVRDGEKQLVLGPFQGPVACTRIPLKPVPRGVCGAAASSQETQLVPDVEKFPGHFSCSSDSRSKSVVPLIGDDGETKLVLDIDSIKLNSFDATDQLYCERIIEIIKQQHF